MNTKKNRLPALLKMFFAPIVFSLFLAILCVYILFYMPTNTVEHSEIISQESIEEEVEVEHPTITPDYHSLVVSHKQKPDLGLSLYRNLESQSALIEFYTKITKNKDVTFAILENADKYNIPLSLAFALAYTESNYKVTAVNKNKNTSIDRGLFQLNNNSFPKLTESEFFDPYTSAYYGLAHLSFCLDTAGNEVAALAMYNAGTNRVRTGGTPQMTLNYVDKIFSYKEGLDALLYSELIEFTEPKQNTYLAMTGK